MLLSGLMILYQTLLTPLYLQLAKLGLANTHLGLAIVHTLLQLPFSIYLMRQFRGAAAGTGGCRADRRLHQLSDAVSRFPSRRRCRRW